MKVGNLKNEKIALAASHVFIPRFLAINAVFKKTWLVPDNF